LIDNKIYSSLYDKNIEQLLIDIGYNPSILKRFKENPMIIRNYLILNHVIIFPIEITGENDDLLKGFLFGLLWAFVINNCFFNLDLYENDKILQKLLSLDDEQLRLLVGLRTRRSIINSVITNKIETEEQLESNEAYSNFLTSTSNFITELNEKLLKLSDDKIKNLLILYILNTASNLKLRKIMEEIEPQTGGKRSIKKKLKSYKK